MQMRSGFFGRDGQKQLLLGHIRQARDGLGTTVLVTGEAGVGKSRLVEEALVDAGKEGFETLTGKCLYGEGTDPYLPFIDMLKTHFSRKEKEKEKPASDTLVPRGMLGIGGDDGVGDTDDAKTAGRAGGSEDEGQKAPPIMYSLPMGLMGISDDRTGLGGADDDGGEGRGGSKAAGAAASRGEEQGITGASVRDLNLIKERDRMFATVTQMILDIGSKNPTVLFLDDLHWADSATLNLVHHIAKSIQGSRVIMICALRTEELEVRRESVLKEIISKLRKERLIKEIKLEHLDENAAKGILISLFEAKDLPQHIVAKIFTETEGNPYFIEEIAKSLVETGVVDLNDKDWVSKLDVDAVRIPGSVNDLIQGRYEALEEEQRRILEMACVVGEEFSVEVLSKLTGKGEEDLIDEMDRLLETKMVIEVEGGTGVGTYRFNHKAVREAVYDNLSRARKRLLHKKVGAAIEAAGKGGEKVIYQLAYHYTMGRQSDKALEYNIKAGEKAHATFALDEVRNYFTKALSLMETAGLATSKEMVQKKVDLLLTLGEINFMQGHWDEALKCNRIVEQLAMKLKDVMLISKAYRMIAYVERQRGNWDVSYKYYTDALAIAQKLKDVFGMSSSLRGLGYLHWRRGEFDDAIRHYEESLKISKEINDKYNMGRTYIELGNVLNERGILAGAEFHYNTAIEILLEIGDQFELSRAFNNLGDIYLKKEEWENALIQFEKTIQYTIKIGDLHMRSWAYFNAAECYSKMGKTAEAEKYLEESKKLLWNSDDQVGIAYLFAEYAILYRFKKDYARSDDSFKKAIKMVEDLNIPPVAAYMYIEYGQMLGDMGKPEEARKWIEKALAIFLKLNANIYADRVQKILKRFKND